MTRLALNAHPEIACPPELHLLKLGQRLLWTTGLTTADRATGNAADGDPWRLAIRQSRSALNAIMDDYLNASGKSRWAEKSVTSINHIDVLNALFPESLAICLVRHPRGVISSGLRAIRDRADGYDFEPYLARFADRQLALLEYWIDKTQTILSYLEDHRDRSCLVRYEDILSAPNKALNAMASALGLPTVPDWSQRIFATEHQKGPGDTSAYERREIDATRRLAGADLDFSQATRRTVRRANGLLDRLNYPPLEGVA